MPPPSAHARAGAWREGRAPDQIHRRPRTNNGAKSTARCISLAQAPALMAKDSEASRSGRGRRHSRFLGAPPPGRSAGGHGSRLVAQCVGGGGLEAVTILVRASHRFLQASQVLVDPNAGILSEEGGDHVGELTARRTVLERYPHEGAPVRPGLEAHGARGFNPCSLRAPRDELVGLVIDDHRISPKVMSADPRTMEAIRSVFPTFTDCRD